MALGSWYLKDQHQLASKYQQAILIRDKDSSEITEGCGNYINTVRAEESSIYEGERVVEHGYWLTPQQI